MKYFIEVGSTVTKCDRLENDNLIREREVTILFKKHYEESKNLNYDDVDSLVDFINSLEKSSEIIVYGTSVFRKLSSDQYDEFYEYLKDKTGIEFKIISQEDEGVLTTIGAAHKACQKVCVMIGGGGSTEVSIYDGKIIESANSNIGVIDVLNKFPDLSDDIATSSLEEVTSYIKENFVFPKNKADILILAGGGHEKFARLSGINYEDNTLYKDNFAPIMMDIETRKKDSFRYYKEISLDAIKAKVDDPAWWDATRAMCAFVLVLAEHLDAKYIVPTDIAIAHGIIASDK